MDKNIKKITDKSLFADIYNNVFAQKNVFIKTVAVNIQVDYFLFKDGKIYIKITTNELLTENIVLYVRHENDIYFTHTKFLSKDKDSLITLEPVDIQIAQLPRKEDRVKLASSDKEETPTVYISNILTDFALKEIFLSHKKHVEFLKDEIIKKVASLYKYNHIHFVHEKSSDLRMELFLRERMPYMIKNINDKQDIDKNPYGKYYVTNIFPNSSFADKNLISEIAVPFMYKMMLPFGYVQVNNTKPMTDEEYSSLKKLGMSTSTIFTNDKQIIQPSEDKIFVKDLSLHGLGIYFKNKVFIRHFKENSYIIATVYFADKKNATILGVVKHISLIKGMVYKVGCEIINIDPIGEANFLEYLDARPSGQNRES